MSCPFHTPLTSLTSTPYEFMPAVVCRRLSDCRLRRGEMEIIPNISNNVNLPTQKIYIYPATSLFWKIKSQFLCFGVINSCLTVSNLELSLLEDLRTFMPTRVENQSVYHILSHILDISLYFKTLSFCISVPSRCICGCAANIITEAKELEGGG